MKKIWKIQKKSKLNSEKIWKIQKKSKVNSETDRVNTEKSGWWWCCQTFVRNVIIEINNAIMKTKWRGRGG